MIIPPRRDRPHYNRDGLPNRRLSEFFERLAQGVSDTQGEQGIQGVPGVAGPAGTSVTLPTPESLSFSYNPDGTVSNISGATTNIDFTYSGGLVSSIYDQTYLKNFSYNGSNQLTTITVT